MSTPRLQVVENKTNPRSDRYVAFIEDDVNEGGSAIIGSGPTEIAAVVDAMANLAPILTELRHRNYELVTVESAPDEWRKHLAAIADPR